jgi:putative acetyltransferase
VRDSDTDPVDIRPFRHSDAAAVRNLFVTVNRALAPAEWRDRFETYIDRSIAEEIGRIDDYYLAGGGMFWVAYRGAHLIGMAGVEPIADGAMELRRMYVSPKVRRQGLARLLLSVVESWCAGAGIGVLHLSTSELQTEAIALYESAGFRFVGETVADTASNKTIGGGIRRRAYVKHLPAHQQ